MSDDPKPCRPIVDGRILLTTVRDLLTHTGGWDRDVAFDPMFRSQLVAAILGIAGPSECENVIYYMFGQELPRDPGTTYAYSNFGYCVLGRIVERVTGYDYKEAVRRTLLDPAGVSREEMYVGSTRLEDVPEIETGPNTSTPSVRSRQSSPTKQTSCLPPTGSGITRPWTHLGHG